MTDTQRLRGRLSTDDIVIALAACPALERMSNESLHPLAEQLELRTYERHELLLAGRDGELGPLRVLCFGRIFWSSERYPEQRGAWVLTPGAVFGLRALNEWVARDTPGRWHEDAPRVRAEAQSRVWVLELPLDRFDDAFSGHHAESLIAALLALFPVNIHAPELVRGMRQLPQFSRVASTRLYELLQHAVAHQPGMPAPAEALEPGADPQQASRQVIETCIEDPILDRAQVERFDPGACTSMQYVLRGEVRTAIAGQPALTLRAGDLVGAGELLSEQPKLKATTALASDTWLVSLSNMAFQRALVHTPTMAMMLGPAHLSGAQCPDGDAPSYPLLSHATMTLVLADQAIDPSSLGSSLGSGFDLPAAVEGLAQALRADFGERVWVLHIVPEPAPPSPPSTALFEPPHVIAVPASVNVELFVRQALEQFEQRYGLFFDQILVEASAFAPVGLKNGELWSAMLGLNFPAKVEYLIDAPAQWDQIPESFLIINLLMGVEAQPVVLLEPLGDLAPLYALIQEFGDLLAGTTSLGLFASALPAKLVDLFERWVVVATQVYGSSYFIPDPWPLDAVRLRLSPSSGAPTPEQLQAEGASYSRWARAVSSRRVGLAVGGAGALSFVGIPFIRGLMHKQVPIDILSGASAGSYVGAFFSGQGDQGLSRLEWSWPALEVGALLALFNNFPITWWLAWATQYADLSEIDLPVVSISTHANTGDAFQQTAGLIGKSLIASGSIPPLVSTFIGNDRLLDGGLSEDVPTAVLDAAGANLNLGVQPIPKPLPLPGIPDFLPIPAWKKYLITLNPLLRSLDLARAYEMIFRQAAYAQDQYADVFYVATTKLASAGFFWQVPRIIEQAEHSASLQAAVQQAADLWARLASFAPGRLRVDPQTGAVELGSALTLSAAITSVSPAEVELIGYTARILARLAETVLAFPARKITVAVRWPGSALPSIPVQVAARDAIAAAADDGVPAPGLPVAQLEVTHLVAPAQTQPELDAALIAI